LIPAYFLAPLFAARDRAHVSLHAYADFSRHAPGVPREACGLALFNPFE
jgi:hypothetical protein